MTEFDELQSLWKSQKRPASLPGFQQISLKSQTTRHRLMRQLVFSGVTFLVATLFLIRLFLPNHMNLHFPASIAAFLVLTGLCLLQSVLQWICVYYLLKINELQIPSQHIRLWQEYFDLRRKILHIHGNFYIVILNVCMVVLGVEILKDEPVTTLWWFGVGYTVWVLLCWFVIRKRILAKESQQIASTIQLLQQNRDLLDSPAS